jgi:hypothetical protein
MDRAAGVLAGVLWVDSAVCAVVFEGLGAVLKLGTRLWWWLTTKLLSLMGLMGAVRASSMVA